MDAQREKIPPRLTESEIAFLGTIYPEKKGELNRLNQTLVATSLLAMKTEQPKPTGNSPTQWEKDRERLNPTIRRGVSEKELQKINDYFVQDMLSLATYILMEKSKFRLSIGSMEQKISMEVFHETLEAPLTLRVIIDVPQIVVNPDPTNLSTDPNQETKYFNASIPGKITIDYLFDSYHFELGFSLKSLTFNNTVLEKLFLEPIPDDPNFFTERNFKRLYAEANRQTPEAVTPSRWNMRKIDEKELLKLGGDKYEWRQYLKKIMTRDIEVPYANTNLATDIGEAGHKHSAVSFDSRQITRYDLLEMSAYYTQRMLDPISELLFHKTEGKLHFSHKAKVHISRNKNNQIELSAVYQDPAFTVMDPSEGPCTNTVPGLIMVNYVFEFGKGFTFKDIILTKTVSDLIRNPTQCGNKEDLEELHSQGAKEDPIIPEKIVTTLPPDVRRISFDKNGEKLLREARRSDIGKINGEDFVRADNIVLPELDDLQRVVKTTPLIAHYIVRENSGGKTLLQPGLPTQVILRKNETNEIFLTVLLNRPLFITEGKIGKTFPGCITMEYQYDTKSKQFVPREITTTNDIIHGLISCPLQNLNLEEYERLNERALAEEEEKQAQHELRSQQPVHK